MSWGGALEAAFVGRDVEAFRAAVAALDVPVDSVLAHDRPIVCCSPSMVPTRTMRPDLVDPR